MLNSNNFAALLQHPQDVNSETTEALAAIIKTYPYFQAAKALHLKGLKQQESTAYNTHLKITAAYTTDRSILFDFITSDVFIQNEISKAIKQNNAALNTLEVDEDDITVNKSLTIDDTLKQQIQDTIGVLDPDLFQPKSTSVTKNKDATLQISKPEASKKTPENTLKLGQPLQFEKQETHSFNQWLKLTQLQPINRAESQANIKTSAPEDKTLSKNKQNEIIDKFIAENPKIGPAKTVTTKGNLANSRGAAPEGLMTETLARIYVEQKNYKKAIQSYNILSLKYPEKSGFFADQIKAIEQLQEQNK